MDVLLYIRGRYMKTESQKRAQKKYFDKKLKLGWKWVKFFVPKEVKNDMLKYKSTLMIKYYDIHK